MLRASLAGLIIAVLFYNYHAEIYRAIIPHNVYNNANHRGHFLLTDIWTESEVRMRIRVEREPRTPYDVTGG